MISENGTKGSKVYEHSSDLHVRKTVVYSNGVDGNVYADPLFTRLVTPAELENFFEKGLIIADNLAMYAPLALFQTEAGKSVMYMAVDETPTIMMLGAADPVPVPVG